MMVEQQTLDELALLGGEDNDSDRLYTGDINEDELLGLNEQTSQGTTASKSSAILNTQSAIPDEIEQLDYDEDEEEKKPRDKFTSERKTETVTTNVDSNQKAGAKCFVNPKFQNRLPNPSTSGPPTALPSLLSQPIMPPSTHMIRPPVDVNMMARMVMMNSLRPLVPPNQMNPMMRPPVIIPGLGFPVQNPSFPPPGTNPMMNGAPGPGPITAKIGQLSTVIHQQNDGTVTFRTTIPASQPPRVTIARAGCSDQNNQNKDWNSMVDEFIKAPTRSRKRDGQSRSGSSRSRSYSNSSYSGSYSGDSYSSVSGSSRSPSPSRHRRRRRSPSRKRNRPSYRHSSHRRYSYRRERSRRSPRRSRTSKTNELKNTLECAEAVGLDQDYVRKLEEQQKLREEVARQKYKRDNGSRAEDTKRSSRRGEESSSSRSRRTEDERSKSKTVESKPQQQASTQVSSSNSSGENKVKPYLVVVINNLANLSDAYKRLKMIAQAVGPTKRLWQTDDSTISVIFEKHEDAKQFMLQYHMKQFNGVTLNIGLEKIFLNLASIP